MNIILKLPKKRILLFTIFALFIFYLISGLNNDLRITNYTIHTNKIISEIKIVFLSDLHSCSYGESQNQLIEAINKQKPDVILMSGDIADDILRDIKVRELLDGIEDKYPCYYVTGNHEFWSGRVEEQKNMFRSYGVHVLEGTSDMPSIKGQYISICGVDDPDVGYQEFENQLGRESKSIKTDKYKILLSHRPELFTQYVACQFELVLSGHAHGGQWRIPFLLPDGFYSPDQGFFPKYTQGIYQQGNTKMLVSRGLSRESTRIPRFFNPPELVVIHLVP